MQEEEIRFRKELGAKIQALREFKKYTQADLASMIGHKDFQTISRIENGNVTTSIYTIHLIAKALNETLDELTTFN